VARPTAAGLFRIHRAG
jgi:hypothetical protein